MGDNKVFIVIPVHNGILNTMKCLESIEKLNYKYEEVIIVDDGSNDGTYNIISEAYPSITLLKGNGNLWWSGGVNKGISYALSKGADFVLLLNNDNIIDRNSLNELIKTSKEYDDRVIVCSKVIGLGQQNKIFFAGGEVDWRKKGMYIIGYNECNLDMHNICTESKWCGGMGVLISRHIFKSIGYFDDINFPQYFGDADFMFRGIKEGYRLIYQPKSIVWNNVEQTGLDHKGNINSFYNCLFSIKSNYNIKINVRFLRKYCPKHLIILNLFRKYFTLFAGFVKYNVVKAARVS